MSARFLKEFIHSKHVLLNEIVARDPVMEQMNRDMRKLQDDGKRGEMLNMQEEYDKLFEEKKDQLKSESEYDLNIMLRKLVGCHSPEWKQLKQGRPKPIPKKIKMKINKAKVAQANGGTAKEQWGFLTWNGKAENKCKCDEINRRSPNKKLLVKGRPRWTFRKRLPFK